MPPRPIIATFDPSSTCIGFALWARLTQRQQVLVDAGRLTPEKVSEADYVRRTNSLDAELRKLLHDYPTVCIALLEIPASKQHGRMRSRAVGLAAYGFAVGRYYATCREKLKAVLTVRAGKWSTMPKGARANLLRLRYRQWTAEADPGGDVADALELGLWLSTQEHLIPNVKGSHA
jgi:hypothetical protein